MAGAGYKLFNTGDVLTAAQVNTYLQEQAVMRFANSTARTTALSGVLAEGMVSYLDDTNLLEVYNGSAWVGVGSSGDITGVTAGTGISGGGTSGDVTITNSMATAIDAKGDLIVGTGADTFARLAVGATNGHILTVDSAEATGMKWAAAAGGADYVKITASNFSAVGSHSVSSVFSSTYKFYDIFVEMDSSSGSPEISMRLRSGSTDATTNYGSTRLYAYGSTFGFDSNAGLGTDEWFIMGSVSGYATQCATRIWIGTPYDATATTYATDASYYNGSSFMMLKANGSNSNATSYDGFTLIASTGTITGTVYVYGVKA